MNFASIGQNLIQTQSQSDTNLTVRCTACSRSRARTTSAVCKHSNQWI